MQETTLALLSLGFGLGLLHALDADHIMAVSSLAYSKDGSARCSRRRTVRFCIQWAIGHGGILLLLAVLVLATGVAIPAQVSFLAEKAVGVILITLGMWIFWQFYQNRLQLHVHSHESLTHAHLDHVTSGSDSTIIRNQKNSKHDHRPMLVGITHGLAGSAPVLAILPLAQSGQGWFGLLYVAMFSFGVVATMLVFGLCFNKFQNTLQNYSRRLFDVSRLTLASLSIGFGGYWLFSA